VQLYLIIGELKYELLLIGAQSRLHKSYAVLVLAVFVGHIINDKTPLIEIDNLWIAQIKTRKEDREQGRSI